MSRRKSKEAPCKNCDTRPHGMVSVVTEEGCCVLCGKDLAESNEVSFAQQRIALQSEMLSDLMEAHEACSGHIAQSLLAQHILTAAQMLVQCHDDLAGLRCPSLELR